MKVKVLIAGSTGFLGRNLYEYLLGKEDIELHTLDSKQIDFIDEKKIEEYLSGNWYDVILMCANYGIGRNKDNDVNKVLEYNMRIVLNFEKCSHYFGKMLYFGSGAEYDKRYDISMVTEEDFGKNVPVEQYGLYKYIVNKLIEQSSNIYNLRLFGIFGKYEDWRVKFISNLCCKAIKDIPLSIRKNVYFDYLWVEDFCRIVEYFIFNDCKYHTYNVVNGKPVSLLQLADIVKEVSGKSLPVYICQDGLGKEYTASNQRLMEEMKSFEYTDIKDSIKELYGWYKENEGDIEIYPLIYQ